MKRLAKWSAPLLCVLLLAAAHFNAASATSLPVSATAPFAARVADDTCTSQTFQGSIPVLTTLQIANIPDACIGKQIVVYTFGTSLSATPAYVGTITGNTVSFPISSLLSLSILGVNVSVDGWGAKVNWLGSLY